MKNNKLLEHHKFQKYINKSIYYKFTGSFYRSTISLDRKLNMLKEFLINDSIENLIELNKKLSNAYDTKLIQKRNKEWRCYYNY